MLVGEKIGPFAVDRELGAGAMGAVYRARHVESGQRVAIKVMAPVLGSNDVAMARFRKEADILKQLKHPNIVRLFATGKFKGNPFYAMEFVEGESLDRVLARRGRFSWEEVVELGKQLCAALKHAHDHGIVHRDLKPSNVMVLADGTLKLTDFGIAKDLDATALTAANSTVGTAAYMSPEQCRGERDISHKSDLYSLGAVFFELLTGRKPFVAESAMDMFMKHVHEPVERPSRIVLDIPVWLDTIVCQLMEKKAEQRPFDAAIVADSLERVREKVATLTSAGVDTVRGRAAERPKDRAKLDEEDKEAARALLGKKKKKKRAVPFHQARWFHGSILSVGLLTILFVFYLVFFKAPSTEALYAEARGLHQNKDFDALLRDDGPLKQFLRYYSERDDEQARQMRQWAVEVPRDKAERNLLRRFRRGIDINVDAEEILGRQAIQEEDDGKLVEASATWTRLLRHKESDHEDKRNYALVAEERIKRLQEVERNNERLLDAARVEPPRDDISDPFERQALEAILAESKEPAHAKTTWLKLMDAVSDRDDPAQRVWYLLAAKHLCDLGKQSPPPGEGKSG